MKLTFEKIVFDNKGNLKLMPDERILVKRKLLCLIYLKNLLLKKSFAPVTIWCRFSYFLVGRSFVPYNT